MVYRCSNFSGLFGVNHQEVAVTRTTIRHTLSALAALALVSDFAISPVSAWTEVSQTDVSKQIMSRSSTSSKQKTPKGLATKNGRLPSGESKPAVIYMLDMSQ